MSKHNYKTGFRRKYLIDARVKKGWSREELARRIGATKGTVEWWEYGYSEPSEEFRKRLARVFNLCNRLDDDYDIEEYIDAFLELTPAK